MIKTLNGFKIWRPSIKQIKPSKEFEEEKAVRLVNKSLFNSKNNNNFNIKN